MEEGDLRTCCERDAWTVKGTGQEDLKYLVRYLNIEDELETLPRCSTICGGR